MQTLSRFHPESVYSCKKGQKYLHKDVNQSQRANDQREYGRTANDNNHGGHRGKEGAQEHEDGGREDLIDHVNVLGEAVDDPAYGGGVKERLGCVKFVVQQGLMQLACGLDFPQSQSKGGKHNQDACVRETRGGAQHHYTTHACRGLWDTGELQSGSQTRAQSSPQIHTGAEFTQKLQWNAKGEINAALIIRIMTIKLYSFIIEDKNVHF